MPLLNHTRPIHKVQLQKYQKVTKFYTNLVYAIQQYSLILWAARNNILHNGTIESDAILNASIDAEINQIYWEKDKYQPNDRNYFCIPVENILRCNTRGKRRWLYLARVVSSQALKRAKTSHKIQQPLQTFFPPKKSTTNPTTKTKQTPTPLVQLKHYQQTSLASYFYDCLMLPKIFEVPN